METTFFSVPVSFQVVWEFKVRMIIGSSQRRFVWVGSLAALLSKLDSCIVMMGADSGLESPDLAPSSRGSGLALPV